MTLGALCVAGFVACGGGPEDYEIDSAQANAAGAVADIGFACNIGSGVPSEARLSGKVDDLLAAYERSEGDAEVVSYMEEAAGDLRECGMDDLADRLNEKTDG